MHRSKTTSKVYNSYFGIIGNTIIETEEINLCVGVHSILECGTCNTLHYTCIMRSMSLIVSVKLPWYICMYMHVRNLANCVWEERNQYPYFYTLYAIRIILRFQIGYVLFHRSCPCSFIIMISDYRCVMQVFKLGA